MVTHVQEYISVAQFKEDWKASRQFEMKYYINFTYKVLGHLFRSVIILVVNILGHELSISVVLCLLCCFSEYSY